MEVMKAACVWVLLGACGFDHGAPQRTTGDGSVADDARVLDDAVTSDDMTTDAGIAVVVIPLAANNDDALQDPPPGNATLVNYSWISMYTAGHWGAMRFVVPSVARNATIVDAYLDVYVDTDPNEDDPNIAIASEATASPGTFAAVANNISSRPRGSAIVVWQANNIGSGTRRSPSLSTVVQERVNDPGWMPGRAIVFIFDVQGPSFEVRQRDHTSGMFAPALTVRFINP
jgi:hypothetical protein